ncbi:hypothetical protein HMPREF9098_0569 [Kingella denitrificans ATCC 33394]|uniref:Uncharacterized protein n=1 Tax=Kingella denitrificans ATCC 33394 TaxID=888741 RepID=F0EXI5_9NEIS|nr:hypothetical protein HMPREF9098_0569 [Kingella denitrificans ATCC 33394]
MNWVCRQSPSGGCVLKLQAVEHGLRGQPVAFGRLRVETLKNCVHTTWFWTVAFGRLRVETGSATNATYCPKQSPSGGCVLKLVCGSWPTARKNSRLRAAAC